MRSVGRRLVIAGAVGLAVVFAGTALGSQKGSLKPQDCIIVGTDPACGESAPQTLNPDGMAISPDGKNVYVANDGQNTVSNLEVKGDGSLKYGDCVGDDSVVTGCAEEATGGLFGVENVAVSPNGKYVFAVSDAHQAVALLKRNSDGSLNFKSCVSSVGMSTECEDDTAVALSDVQGVVVSPDNKHVYTASTISDAVEWFKIAAGGTLEPKGCVSDSSGSLCPTTMPGLVEAENLAISPDGESVYVPAEGGGTLAILDRKPNGDLEPVHCWGDDDLVTPCTKTADGLDQADTAVVSNDGKNVYVASEGDGLSVFERKGNGRLNDLECHADLGDCKSVDGLSGASGVAVSPDDEFVYAVGEQSGVHSFARDPSSKLKKRGDCIRNTGGPGSCPKETGGLIGAETIVVGKGGDFVYVGAESGGTVAWLKVKK